MLERQVHFVNHGQKLYGMLHIPDGLGPHPGVILLHGFTGNSKESHFLFVKAARDFARHGLAAMRFDFRGSGDSEGDFVDMTVLEEISDAHAALDYLCVQPEIDGEKIGLLGLSLGGCVAACTAGSDTRVKSLVLWSAAAFFCQRAHTRRETGDNPLRWLSTMNWDLLRQQGWHDIGGLRMGWGFVSTIQELDPLAQIANYTGPTLVVQGTEDGEVSVADAEAYHESVSGRKELLLVEGADHTFSSCPWEDRVIVASRNWFLDTLGDRYLKEGRQDGDSTALSD